MRVLGFGTYDKSRHPRVGVLFEGLRQAGIEVEELNHPAEASTEQRVSVLQHPRRLLALARPVIRSWIRLALASRADRRSLRPDAVIVGYLGHLDVLLARALFPRTVIVLDLLVLLGDTARDRRVTSGPRVWTLDLLDRLATAVADVVLVDTQEQVGLLPARAKGKAVVVPVGAPTAWFEARRPPDAAAAGQPLRVVFYGLFTPLQGTEVIGQALRLLGDHDDLEFTIIGHGQDQVAVERLTKGLRNLQWMRWVPPEDLPGVVASHDLCLGIFGTSSKAIRVVPNKVFQAAAAGCAVITSDTEPQRRMLGRAAVFVPAGSPSALADALLKLVGDPARVVELRRAAARRADDGFAPARVATPLVQALRQLDLDCSGTTATGG